MNTSIRNEDYQHCHIKKSSQSNASSSFDKRIDEDTKHDSISMARIVVDIICSVSAAQARSQFSDNVCPNQGNKLHDGVECPNEKTSDYFKCTIHDKAERKHIAFSDIDDSNLSSCNDQDMNSSDHTNLIGCTHSSGICKKSATNLNDNTSNVSSQRNMDIAHEIISEDIHNRVLSIDKRSRYEENCSTSRETDCSLKKIMDEYDKKFPDEDDEANSYYSRYH